MADMTDSKRAWDDVGDRFAALGRRFDQHRSAKDADAPGAAADEASETASEPVGEPGPAEAAGERDRLTLQAALDDLGRALDRVTNAIGPTVRDPAFRDDAKAAVRSLGDALGATFSEVGGNVRDALRRDSPSKSGAPDSTDTPDTQGAPDSEQSPSS